MVPGRRRRTGHRRDDCGRHQEIARHALSTPGNPRIVDAHYPNHPGRQPSPPAPAAATHQGRGRLPRVGDGAHSWLVEAAATGATRVRAKMARAVELAAVLGPARVDQALGLAATAGRFDEHDLGSILDHLALHGDPGDLVRADETHSAQPGTSAWSRSGASSASADDHIDHSGHPTSVSPTVSRGRRAAPPRNHQADNQAQRAGGTGPAGRTGRAAAADAAALPTRRRPRRPGHRQSPTLGPRRSAPGAHRRGGHRPRRRHPPDAPQNRELPLRQDVRHLAGGRLVHPGPTQQALSTLEWINRAREPRGGRPIRQEVATSSKPSPTPRSKPTCGSPGSPSRPSPAPSAGPKPTAPSPAPSPGSAAPTSSSSTTSACCRSARTPPKRSTASSTPPTNGAQSP